MKRAATALLGLGLALTASQAGHLVVYQLRYGGAALRLQGSGSHAYFPALVKMGLGTTAAAALVALLAVGFARLAGGRPVRSGDAPPFMRLLAILFSVQLAAFLVQETLEAALTGAASTSPGGLLLWGALGQLLTAGLAALALRWLVVEVAPALEQLALRPDRALVPVARIVVLSVSPARAELAVFDRHLTAAFNRRGPPS